MLYAARNDNELAGFDPFVMVAEFHAEAALDDEEHLVFVLVMMENELAFQLIELHVLAVEFGGDVGLPVFGDLGEFLGDVYFRHGILTIGLSLWLYVEWMPLGGCWSPGIFGMGEIGRAWFGGGGGRGGLPPPRGRGGAGGGGWGGAGGQMGPPLREGG